MPFTLLRLEGATLERLRDPERLAAGLLLHLAHAPLHTLLIQIEGAQRAYVALDGCDGCQRGRCAPGCRVELLRRLVRAAFDSGRLEPVPRGLATRAYRQVGLAVPRPLAMPLDGDVLAPWASARLAVRWQAGAHGDIVASAVLAAEEADPSPAAQLKAYGWTALPVPLLPGRAFDAVERSLQQARRRWRGEPFLLLASAGPQATEPTVEDAPSEDDLVSEALATSPLAAALDRVLVLAREAGPPAPASSGDGAEPAADGGAPSPWPTGPGGMTPADVGELVARLRSDPAIIAATPAGVTKGRLRGIVDGALAELLMVWLNAAGVLAEPSRPEVRWREPRLLRADDDAAIAERLAATPLPDEAAVREALGSGR